MQNQIFEFMGRRIELWAHPDPDHVGRTIRINRSFYEMDVLMKCREVYLPGTAIIDVALIAKVGSELERVRASQIGEVVDHLDIGQCAEVSDVVLSRRSDGTVARCVTVQDKGWVGGKT